MSERIRRSRCGFVLIKLSVNGQPFLLMRKDVKWRDLNFIGGHMEPHDSDLFKAAKRELLEEVPSLRGTKLFEMFPITSEIPFGPVKSRKSSGLVKYELQFFGVEFKRDPTSIVESITNRSGNILMSEKEILSGKVHNISRWVRLLDQSIHGGLNAIPTSWPFDIAITIDHSQLILPLKWNSA